MNFIVRNFFVVKHKIKYSSESAIYVDLDAEIIKENCEFQYYFNATEVNQQFLMEDMKLY